MDAEVYPNGRVVIATDKAAQEFVDGAPTAAVTKTGVGNVVEGFGPATGCVAHLRVERRDSTGTA